MKIWPFTRKKNYDLNKIKIPLGLTDFSYGIIKKIKEENGLTEKLNEIKEEEKRNFYFDALAFIRKELFDIHIKQLSDEEQKLISDNNHPSFSHKFDKEAEKYVKMLKDELTNLDYVEDVVLGYYHCDRLILSIKLSYNPGDEEIDKSLPWLFHGFETRYGILKKNIELTNHST